MADELKLTDLKFDKKNLPENTKPKDNKPKNNKPPKTKKKKVSKKETLFVDWDSNKLQKFMIVLILGYFGTKIFYGLFGKSSLKSLNHEMSDFVSMLVMGGILYLLTSMEKRHLLGTINNTNWLFFIGYLIGLNIPYINNLLPKTITDIGIIRYIVIAIGVFTILIMLFLSISSSDDNPMYYILYLLVITLVILGIIYTRKKSKKHCATKISDDDEKKIIDEGIIETQGHNISFGLGITAWIMSLLFMYDAEEDIIQKTLGFINGVMIGIFVSSVSFDGLTYILSDGVERKCFDGECKAECEKGKEIMANEEYGNTETSIETIKWVLALTIITLILIILLFYMTKDY